ncbi:hypothetical protein EOD39_8476 [Acipenser ruthenus]|uniref:Uncharacterized protein n=1 Tax=Acipenser ruthenus TaxID=7906 RepID=A0A662YXT1_ACIRT|nr:hypothetical protein EOD39_8476 [Acipenser ruthenus]
MSGEGESVWGPVSVSHGSTEPPLGAARRGSSKSEIPAGDGSLPAVTVYQGLGTGGRDGPGSQSGSVLAPGSGREVSGSAESQPAVATVSFLADSLSQQEGGGVAVADYDTMEEAEFSVGEDLEDDGGLSDSSLLSSISRGNPIVLHCATVPPSPPHHQSRFVAKGQCQIKHPEAILSLPNCLEFL